MSAEELAGEFDLQPDPRILPMLGEINLHQWRCIAELVDNSIDGFLKAKGKLEAPAVHVTVPTSDADATQVVVRDNGPGMSADMLEKAVRAGWSGNNPIESLGLFGMGFNIATARLGTVTTVWTTQRNDLEWHGVRIDFGQLQAQGHFRTPHLKRPKTDQMESGTEIRIERLKVEQRAHFAKSHNRSRIKKELATAYGSMLREGGTPLEFHLEYMGNRIAGKRHCVWDEARTVSHSLCGEVPAVQGVGVRLASRPYCINCWNWVNETSKPCPFCAAGAQSVVDRERSVQGWIGIQRFLDRSDFGIDLIRNGRKIEMGNKDLFVWRDEDGAEEEYPLDDPRGRGRIVGEVHLNHCRVNYSKDRFDRSDPAWNEMISIIRGEGPLRPMRAKDLGFPQNQSPLYKLFQVFRRSSPKPKAAGWRSVLVVEDNNRAMEMAKRFDRGDPEYQDDSKWWELIEEQDRKLLLGEQEEISEDLPAEFGTEETSPPEDEEEESEPPERVPIPSLTNEYLHDETGQRWDLRAWSVLKEDPELARPGTPWALIRRSTGSYDFLVIQEDSVFRSATLAPLDALMAELAHAAMDFLRIELPEGVTFASILADLRKRYATSTQLEPVLLSNQARLTLRGIASSLAGTLDEKESKGLFNDLPDALQEKVRRAMATRGVTDPDAVVSGGRFLEYGPREELLGFFSEHPELFLDGRYWDQPYSTLDLGSAAATDEAQKRIVRERENLLSDALWLAENEPDDLLLEERSRLLRARLALELLEPDVPTQES